MGKEHNNTSFHDVPCQHIIQPKVLSDLLGVAGRDVQKEAIASRVEGDLFAKNRILSAVDWWVHYMQ